MADYLNIAGRVRTTASDGVAMEAQEVKDLNQNKSQQDINADVQTELGDRYTKEETYSKEQLDELITTPDVNRVYVIATNLTTAVTDLLPATGSSDTLYNVGNWNGTQYDTTVYSIYGWDGTAYVCLAVRSSIGEVYDISANHPDGQGNPTPYADLAAALGTNGANIPADIRRGGMRIQFIQGTVQSSDNKYKRFDLIADEFTTDTSAWRGVESDGEIFDDPTNTDKEQIPTVGAITDVYGYYRKSKNFIYVITDKNNKIAVALEDNGNVYYGKGIPQQIKDYIDEKVAALNGDITAITNFLAGIETTTLKEYLDDVYGYYIEDKDKNLKIEVDPNNKIVSSRDKDGKLHENVGIVSPTIDKINQDIEGIEEDVAELTNRTKQIVCWGDSLTMGAGADVLTDNWVNFCATLVSMGYPNLRWRTSMDYPRMLIAIFEALEANYSVKNCGVGGETIITIASRLGAEPVCLSTDIVLPMTAGQKVTVVSGYGNGLKSMYDSSRSSKPLLQGTDRTVNPVYVNGIECTLSVDISNNLPTAYYLTRNANGSRDVIIPANTPIIMKGARDFTDTDIAILWCVTNVGYSSTADLITQLNNMIAHINTKKYIILGCHICGTNDIYKDQEPELAKEYGDKFFNWRLYASTNAMYDFGLTPTADDLTAMAAGNCPPSLLKDSVHLNAVGYCILGVKLYELMQEIGYISIS